MKKKIALLHLKCLAGELDHNRSLIEHGVEVALQAGADWIVTPETAVSGLQFTHLIGTGWITPQPDAWSLRMGKRAAESGAWLFLGQPERGEDGNCYNVVQVLGASDAPAGTQRKIIVHSDGWSTPGAEIMTFDLSGIRVGIMICADAYASTVADAHHANGAQALVAPSSWGPGLYGPEGEWEQRSRETGLPVFVCNRTGEDQTVSFWEAQSLVIHRGKRLLAHSTRRSEVLIFEWDFSEQKLLSKAFEIYHLNGE